MSEQGKTITVTGKLVIGLTGNIATGKSAVMRLAKENGALTIDADQIVHDLMDRDGNMQAAIAVAFGPEVRLPDGRINRRALGKIVFNDAEALRDLEQMVHPAVRLEISRLIQATDRRFVFIEAIKLLEGPLLSFCHQVWVTRCPKQRQIERLMICRGMDSELATRRIDMQPAQEEKVAQADVVIDTAGLMRETETQFELFWGRLPAPESVAPLILPAPVTEETPLAAPPSTTTKPTASVTAVPAKPALPTPAKEKPTPTTRLDRPIPENLKKKLGKTISRPSGESKAPASPPSTSPPSAPPVAITPPPPPTPDPQPVPLPQPEPVLPPPVLSASLITSVETSPETAVSTEVRRARPSDIPSILLLIHRATDGTMKLKRSDMLSDLSERSYFLGQRGTEIQVVMGCSIENLVTRIDRMYFYPLTAIPDTGTAVLDVIERSADSHICEIVVAFLTPNAPDTLLPIFLSRGYSTLEQAKMPLTWRQAIQESQPPGTSYVIKVLRDRVTHPV